MFCFYVFTAFKFHIFTIQSKDFVYKQGEVLQHGRSEFSNVQSLNVWQKLQTVHQPLFSTWKDRTNQW